MKAIVRLFFVIFLLNLIAGCAYYSKMAVPGEPAQQGKYEILKHIKKSVTGTRFLTIPINIPSTSQIIKNEVSSIGGDGIINCEITFSEFNFCLFSFPIVAIEGDIVKIRGQLEDTSMFQDTLSNELMHESELQKSKVDAEEFSNWKKKVMSSINNPEYRWNWKSFKDRHAIKLSKKEWIASLTESEYDEYLNSGKTIDKWLLKKLSE